MSNFDFSDSDRYATDCGPSCPKCHQPDDDTMWLYLCQWPYERVSGTSACCHEHVHFPLSPEEQGSPTILPQSETTSNMPSS